MAFKSPTGPLNLWDLAATLCLGTVMAILSEGVTWCFVYRHPECQHHHKELVKLWRKTQRPPDTGLALDAADKSKGVRRDKKQREVAEKEFQKKQQLVNRVRVVPNIVTALLFLCIMPMAYSFFEGSVCAKLPFHPIPPFSHVTHAKLPGDDYTDCSALPLFSLILMLMKQHIQKLFRVAQPGGMMASQGFGTQQMGGAGAS
eukprot:GHVT01047429.1.p1 GENE.GHVT01047429.1~~GHVT01047429.1.p1  ORF type:complete len:202 (+),score=21.22 GHVT01047429.1:114-719(+)